MSYGCWIDVMNFTGERLTLGAKAKDPNNWENPNSAMPNELMLAAGRVTAEH